MPKPKIRSVRALAKELGISHTTVSDALRNNPRVSLKTRQRVQAAARELGYKYNPLAGSIMSEIRRSSVSAFRGTLSVVDLDDTRTRTPGARVYNELLLKGARETAAGLGFKVDHFNVGGGTLTISRLNSILESRGIRAVLFMPVLGKPAISELNWDHLTGIYTDFLIDDPAIHTVCPDHFRSMTIALDKLIQMGYKRPGLVLLAAHDHRLLFRWEAAFTSYLSHQLDQEPIPPLVTGELSREGFLKWFRKNKPDVVLCHRSEVLDWMAEAGCRIPETHGFCCLNLASAQVNAAGLDLLPQTGGARAMEMLIAQLHRNELGIPERPLTVTYVAQWVDGPTLRQQ